MSIFQNLSFNITAYLSFGLMHIRKYEHHKCNSPYTAYPYPSKCTPGSFWEKHGLTPMMALLLARSTWQGNTFISHAIDYKVYCDKVMSAQYGYIVRRNGCLKRIVIPSCVSQIGFFVNRNCWIHFKIQICYVFSLQFSIRFVLYVNKSKPLNIYGN